MRFHLEEFKRLIGFRAGGPAMVTELGPGPAAGALPVEFKYSQLVSMVEHLNACIEIATQRPASWQNFCKNEDALYFLVKVS